MYFSENVNYLYDQSFCCFGRFLITNKSILFANETHFAISLSRCWWKRSKIILSIFKSKESRFWHCSLLWQSISQRQKWRNKNTYDAILGASIFKFISFNWEHKLRTAYGDTAYVYHRVLLQIQVFLQIHIQMQMQIWFSGRRNYDKKQSMPFNDQMYDLKRNSSL